MQLCLFSYTFCTWLAKDWPYKLCLLLGLSIPFRLLHPPSSWFLCFFGGFLWINYFKRQNINVFQFLYTKVIMSYYTKRWTPSLHSSGASFKSNRYVNANQHILKIKAHISSKAWIFNPQILVLILLWLYWKG